MRRQRVLVSLVSGDPKDLNLARRRVAHDRLVLLARASDRAQAETVKEREGRIGGDDLVTIVPVHGHDARRHMALIEGLLDRHRDADIVLNAAGGDAALSAACLYVAYACGIETWFFQEGRSERLPVLHGLRLADRVTHLEGKVLLMLDEEGATSRLLAERMIVPRDRIETAYRNLRKKGLVKLTARDGLACATLTESGAYVREHLRARRTDRPTDTGNPPRSDAQPSAPAAAAQARA